MATKQVISSDSDEIQEHKIMSTIRTNDAEIQQILTQEDTKLTESNQELSVNHLIDKLKQAGISVVARQHEDVTDILRVLKD